MPAAAGDTGIAGESGYFPEGEIDFLVIRGSPPGLADFDLELFY
jgi:hypothetical protein